MSRYQKGYRVERKAIEELKRKGFSVVRSAGSHGVVDIVAFNEKKYLLLQIKSNNKAPKEEQKRLASLPSPENSEKQIWVHKDRKGFVVYHWAGDRWIILDKGGSNGDPNTEEG